MDQNNLNRPPQAPGSQPPTPPDDSNAPIRIDLEDPKPVAPAKPAGAVSHAPLTLGATGAAPAAARPGVAKPAAAGAKAPPPKIVVNQPPVRQVAKVGASTDRISGVKTFFTKLHPGALDFLDDQINDWLKANPGVRVKMTNTCVGEVQAKKTEANIIITVWY